MMTEETLEKEQTGINRRIMVMMKKEGTESGRNRKNIKRGRK
jgi:hypothetical protein